MRSPKNEVLRRISPYLLSFLALSSQFSLPAGADVGLKPLSDTQTRSEPKDQTTLEIPLSQEAPAVALPVLEPNSVKDQPIVPAQSELHGLITVTESQRVPTPSQLIDHLVEAALAKDTAKNLMENKARYHNKKWTRFVGRSKDMLQYMTSYQGFESSSEGADVILEEKLKLKSRAAVEFVRQKRLDSAHSQLTCAVLEMATGLGLTDEQKKTQSIDSALQEMIPLVGKEEAQQTLDAMTAWSKHISPTDANFDRDPWDVLSVRNKSRTMLAFSLGSDEVVKSIETRLHRYNHHSNFSRAAAKFVNTTCSIIAFSPTLASPAAQTAEFIFVACTGGPEEKKLLKEVYLDRCFESRFERLNQEIGMSLNNYNGAILTHNPVLYCCSQSLMEKLTNPETVANLTAPPAQLLPAPSAQQKDAADEQPHKAFGERI